ncbi:hypothetical protein [uncultured Clostridium sp.]|uniref:hypothetical protein n=1 Tax=uncultured Clostridium sp. TaxID=59620 RepID=UPI0026F1D41C|nr:hypothetical protein [uncultured Clostridium sp.]
MAQKQQPKSDCFAFIQRERSVDCNALNDLYCTKENCKFYMSKEDYIKKNGQSYEQAMLDLERYNKYPKKLEKLD